MEIKKKFSYIEEKMNLGGLLHHLTPEKDEWIERVVSPDQGGKGDLVFIWQQEGIDMGMNTNPSVAIILNTLEGAESFPASKVCTSPDPRLVLAKLGESIEASKRGEEKTIHPHANVALCAVIKGGTIIESGVVIGKNVRIGANCWIGPNTVIEADVVIGDNSVIGGLCFLGERSLIGRGVVLDAGVVIGTRGYGFTKDGNKNLPVPHIGRVVIEDDVSIGAQTCVDRAVFRETRIGAGTKIDNLCHIAHNVTIGKNCLITAGFCVGGSTRIGDRVVTGGQTGIFPHISIADDVHLTFRAGVTDSLTKPGGYAGLPAQPLMEYMKSSAILRRIVSFRGKIRNLERQVTKLLAEKEQKLK